jgi:glyoxylase-like metal-dependent hydrolase (beta-lactamase superfamily II)
LIHAAAGEQPFLCPEGVAKYWRDREEGEGFPPSYSVRKTGVNGIAYDMAPFGDFFWGRRRIRFIPTPGHGRNALSVVVTERGKQIVFCGDAAHTGATIHQPYHLEWDHWTGGGALAAWEGVKRLANLQIDLLCPAHGPIIDQPRPMLNKLAKKLMAFYDAKGHICPGERDDYLDPEPLPAGKRLSQRLVQYSTNGYVLLSDNHEAMLIDPPNEIAQTTRLLADLGNPRATVATATHYHADHSSGLAVVQKELGATVYLHPWVGKALQPKNRSTLPFFPRQLPTSSRRWPERGSWTWNEYTFRIAPFPGQTWWHGCFMTRVDGANVLFAGDSFQPPTRWNGTGGFCAINHARFDGFASSAKLVLQWKPDLLATGHRTYYRFHASQFRKIVAWSKRAEAAVKALCPSGDLKKDYFLT